MVVKIDGNEFLWCFYVVPLLSNDIVMGMDWLSAMDVIIACNEQEIHIGKFASQPTKYSEPSTSSLPNHIDSKSECQTNGSTSSFPFDDSDHFSEDLDSTCEPPSSDSATFDSLMYNIRVRKRTVLPPKSFTKVKLSCARRMSDNILFLPKKKLDGYKQLAFGASLLKMKDGISSTFVLNLSDRPVHLRTNLKIGSCCKYTDDDFVCDVDELDSQKSQKPTFNEILSQLDKFSPSLSSDFDKLKEHFKFGEDLSSDEKSKILFLLKKYSDSFSSPEKPKLGRVPLVQHEIDVGDSKPIRQRAYRVSFKEREVINNEVDKLLSKDIIEHSQSPWSSPVVLVKKPNGGIRFCVDYRKLNVVTKKDSYPLPRIDDALDRLKGANFFTTLDCDQAYYQIPMNENSKDKTAFITPDGLFQFKVLPFGLANSPAVFQRLIDSVLGRLKWTIALVYMDDVICFSKNFDDHMSHLETILAAISKAGLVLQSTKCSFGFSKLKYLGHIISKDGIEVDPEKVRAVNEFPVPKKVKNVQSFVALCSYYRRFIPRFAHIAKPLHDLTRKDVPFIWKDIHQNAFDKLKDLMCTTPILGYPDESSPTEIHADGSGLGLGCCIVQIQNGVEVVIAYASRSLRRHEVNYSATDLECLAVLFSIQKFRPYLYGRHFKLVTDHRALCNLINFKDTHGRAARWSMALQPYDFEIVHRSGKKHGDADGLSRNPVVHEPEEKAIFTKPYDDVDDLCKIVDKKLHSLCALQCENFPNLQYSDNKIKVIIDALLAVDNGDPVDDKVEKKLSEYKLEADILYKAKYDPNARLWRLVVPECLQKELMEEIHCMEASHLGLHKTFELIRDRYYWQGMFKAICNFVRCCKVCQLYNRRVGRSHGPLQPVPPPKIPFVRVGIDFVGPYPLTHPGKNTSVLTVIDHLSRYLEAYPCKGETTQSAIDILKNKIFLRHSVPKVIVADQGSAFTSNEFRQFCKDNGIHLKFCSTAHPETNAICERSHDVFQRTMGKILKNEKQWDKFVSEVTYKYNITHHSVLKMSPFYALYGRSPRLISDNKLPVSDEILNNDESFSHHDKVKEAAKLAYLNSVEAQRNSKEEFDKFHKDFQLVPGDLVVLRNPRAPGKVQKWQPKWQGPFKVIQRIHPISYKVIDARPIHERPLHGKETRVVCIRDIKKYYQNSDIIATNSHDSSSDESTIEPDFTAGSLTSFDSNSRINPFTCVPLSVNNTPNHSSSSRKSNSKVSSNPFIHNSSSDATVFNSASDSSIQNPFSIENVNNPPSVVYNITNNNSNVSFSPVSEPPPPLQSVNNPFVVPALPSTSSSNPFVQRPPSNHSSESTTSVSSDDSRTESSFVRRSIRNRDVPDRYVSEDFLQGRPRTRLVRRRKKAENSSK